MPNEIYRVLHLVSTLFFVLYKLYRKECSAISLKKAQSIISSLGFASHCFSSRVRKIFNKKRLINIIRRGGNNWHTHLCNLPQIGLA